MWYTRCQLYVEIFYSVLFFFLLSMSTKTIAIISKIFDRIPQMEPSFTIFKIRRIKLANIKSPGINPFLPNIIITIKANVLYELQYMISPQNPPRIKSIEALSKKQEIVIRFPGKRISKRVTCWRRLRFINPLVFKGLWGLVIVLKVCFWIKNNLTY